MTIANITKEIALSDDSDFLGLPVSHHLSNQGYWYTYHPSDLDSNNVLSGSSISIYEWDSAVAVDTGSQLSGFSNRMAIDGTAGFIDESHGNAELRYHGGCIQHIGGGVNDITSVTENDAFFTARIGTYGDNNTSANNPAGGSLEDDAFYWDRIYKTTAGGDWKYYQYHKHLPSNYPKFDDGRIVLDGDGYIRPADKQYGYMINVQAKVGGRNYNVPLARIHTPSVGGAHNSHNDVTLPNVAGVNYLNGGIVRGGSNRFHAAYMDSDGTGGYNFYTRTYTSSSGSFTPEVNYGTYPLAAPNFTPYAGGNVDAEGNMSQYPVRLSTGHTFGTKVYWPALIEAVTRSFNIQVYFDNSLNVFRLAGAGGTNGHRDDPTKLDATSNTNGSQNPTVYIKVGDTLTLDHPGYQSHPMYIKNSLNDYFSSSTNIPSGATGGGSQTIVYTPTAPGTYYYACIVHSGMYGKIIVESLAGNVDTQIWSVTDANTISPGTLLRTDMPWQFTGQPNRPDVYITSVGDKLYLAAGSARSSGAHLISANSIDSTGSFYDEGKIIASDSANPVRIHGFKYNATNTKFYTLASAQGQASFKGLYSFDLAGGSFDGYDHLKWNNNGYFENIGPNTSGHLTYDHPTGTIISSTDLEPEGIPNGSSILRWDVASPSFFNRKEINTGSEEYLFQGIYLKDGRKALVGRVEDHEENLGADGTGDLILSIVDNENNIVSYTWGGVGDDFITGIIEDVENDCLVISGYAKGELTEKSKQWVHGWARSLRQTDDSAGVEFTDIARTELGHYILTGNDNINDNAIITTYNKNFDYEKTTHLSLGPDSDNFNSISLLDNNNRLIGGGTKNATSLKNAFLMKLDSDLSSVWQNGFGDGVNYYDIVDHTIIKNSGIEYAICFVRQNPSSNQSYAYQKSGVLIGVNTTTGNITFSKSLDGIVSSTSSYIHKLTPGAPNSGTFFFAGTQSNVSVATKAYKVPLWGYCDINDTNIIKYIQYPEIQFGVNADQQEFDDNEARYSDINWTNYDSGTGTYNLLLVGRKEDVNVPAGTGEAYTDQMSGPGHKSDAIFEKINFVDSTFRTTPQWSKQLKSHKGFAEGLNTLLIEDSDSRPWWFNEAEFFHNGNFRVIATGDGVGLDSEGSTLARSDTLIIGFNDSDGSLYFRNSLGHMGMDHINAGTVWDHNTRNFVTAGWSSSHSPGKDGVLFRGEKEGFGQGVYHTSASTSNAYYYDSAYLYADDFTWGAGYFKDSNPTADTVSLTTQSYAGSIIERSYRSLEYNGSYGANGLFTGFMGIVQKQDLQSFLNTKLYADNVAAGKRLHRADDLFEIHQLSSVGDATADDGNVFMYDVIKSSDGEYYYLAGQASGNISKQNTGLSGVYDYIIAQWDIASKEFRFWQNGGDDDEEIYALTELKGSSKQGQIAFCGRTTGQLSTPTDTPQLGGYDLFLGIFDPVAWEAEYYNQGSGFNDKAMNIHDIDSTIPNTLALVYTSFGSVNGGPTFGSEDIGIITFKYDSDIWSEGFSTGSETSEEIEQNGKPSTRLPDGRIAVVANSAGAFADDAVTFGLKDMVLGIFDFDSAISGGYKGWKKYQVGSGSSDFSYSIDNNGSSLLVTGYSEATWDTEVHGVIVEFDPERNVLAKSSGS